MSAPTQTPTPAVTANPLAHDHPQGTRPEVKVRQKLRTRMWRERWMYTFIVPGLAYFLLFHYFPLIGNLIAFQDFSPFRGILGSQWVGAGNFTAIFSDPEVVRAFQNTLIISGLQLLFAFPAPIALALLLNSLLSMRVRRMVQTVVYLPHFLSWVIVIAIWQQVLGGAGVVPAVMDSFGLPVGNVMANPETFKALVVAQSIWKDVGWGTIIFFAAIAGIPQDYYEAAAVDGAGTWRRIWHVTLPGMIPVITLLLILQIGNILSVGFEQLLLQQPAVGADAAQVLDTFVYYRGVAGGDWGLATAAGLLKGVIATALVIGANKLAKSVGTRGIF